MLKPIAQTILYFEKITNTRLVYSYIVELLKLYVNNIILYCTDYGSKLIQYVCINGLTS